MSDPTERSTDDTRLRLLQLPLSWVGLLFAVVGVTAFAVAVESGRSGWAAGLLALAVSLLAVVAVAGFDAVVGRRWLRIVAHVGPGLFVFSVAFLGSALQLADRFLRPAEYVVLLGLWVVALSLLAAGFFLWTDAPRRVRRVATVGLVATLLWGVYTVGYAVVVLAGSEGAFSGLTVEAVAVWALVVVLIGFPTLLFRWDLRATRRPAETPPG
ncbi:hypothetical protein [Salinirubrum litoreum]|uniref:Uncharacterized protein n=1 Tax=Salinirubrum litoreum TaxID=1126234 RepID=A0ABD5RFL8_9EURY|nr:hypothetical protein [Salinirubrum litoreum]